MGCPTALAATHLRIGHLCLSRAPEVPDRAGFQADLVGSRSLSHGLGETSAVSNFFIVVAVSTCMAAPRA